MAQCECGCRAEATSEFLPGHDQKLRSALERQVGGLLALRELVEASVAYRRAEMSDQELGRRVRVVLTRVTDKK